VYDYNNMNTERESEVSVSLLHQVTPFTKCAAMALCIVLPFVGFWLGTKYSSTSSCILDESATNAVPPTSVVPMASEERDVYEYSSAERALKQKLRGAWFRPYTEQECVVVLSEGTATSCTSGEDGDTQEFLDTGDIETKLATSDDYTCGWDVRESVVATVCGTKSTISEVYTSYAIESINDTQLIIKHPDSTEFLEYRRI